MDSNWLKSSVTNGATTTAVCFNTDVGMVSAADVLSGSHRIALMTSSVVSCRNCRKETPGGARVNVGAGASAVLDLTLATFSAKKWLNTSTSIAELTGSRPRPSKTSTIFHMQFMRIRLAQWRSQRGEAVSYTHLTLPTILRV